MTQPLAHRRPHPLVTSYVDGGVGLVSAPYDSVGWRTVREGWWWHVLAMVVFPPYALAALVVWQRPSGQPLARRVVWAVLVTAGALVLVGLGAFVVFSRRWYWWHRRQEPLDALATAPPAGGPLAHRAAATGGRWVSRVLPDDRRLRPGVALPWLPIPWGALRNQVAAAAVRVHDVAPHASGPAAEVVARAAGELVAAARSAAESAARAAQAEGSLQAVDRSALASDLDALSAGIGDAADLEAARRALHAQSATAVRMADTLARSEGRLRRLAAQAGEVAARTEELVWAPTPAVALDLDGLDAVTDQLVAVRSALDELDQLELPTGAP